MTVVARLDPAVDWLLADVVDWGRGVPSDPVTLGAMLILKAAGRVVTADSGTRRVL